MWALSAGFVEVETRTPKRERAKEAKFERADQTGTLDPTRERIMKIERAREERRQRHAAEKALKANPSSDEKSKTCSNTRAAIRLIEEKRAERRKRAIHEKRRIQKEEKENERRGIPGVDVAFQRLIKLWRSRNLAKMSSHSRKDLDCCVCVRKRPINRAEVKAKDNDVVSILNPRAVVHSCKTKVDGITKYLDNNEFVFDHTFGERETTAVVYDCVARPLVHYAFSGGRSLCFAYGQTGSGKTYTMTGVFRHMGHDIFELLSSPEFQGRDIGLFVSYFEIYSGQCQDLFQKRKRIQVLEDGKGQIQCVGLKIMQITTEDELTALFNKAQSFRSTFATEKNEESSRSHAVCTICLRERPTEGRRSREPLLDGKLMLIDLAGSERADDSKHHNAQRRIESADINKSLLCLKECIRAMDLKQAHIPFRGSKLTLLLKEAFTNPDAKVAMIVAVSPAQSSDNHTLNSLRYADRLKQKDASDMERTTQSEDPVGPPQSEVSQRAMPSPKRFMRSSSSEDGPSKAKRTMGLSPTAKKLVSLSLEEEEKRLVSRGLPVAPPLSPEYGDRSPPRMPPQKAHLSPEGLFGKTVAHVRGASDRRRLWGDNLGGKDRFFPRETLTEEEEEDLPAVTSPVVRQERRKRKKKAEVEAGEPEDEFSVVEKMESGLASFHMASMEENSSLMQREGELLSAWHSDRSDGYAAQLDALLERRIQSAQALRARIHELQGMKESFV